MWWRVCRYGCFVVGPAIAFLLRALPPDVDCPQRFCIVARNSCPSLGRCPLVNGAGGDCGRLHQSAADVGVFFYSLASNPTKAAQVKLVSKVHPRDVALPDMLCSPLAKYVVLPVHFEELQQASIAVTVLEDTWPISFVEAVLTWATSCLSLRHATHPTSFPMRESEAQYLFRMGIVKRLQELLPILVQLCDDMHAAYRIMADAVAYAQTRGGMGLAVLGRLHQPPPQLPDGHAPTVDELTVALLIVVVPKYISHPPIASWRNALVQQASVAKAVVDSLVPMVRAKILSTACMVPPEESPDKQWGIPTV